MGWHIFIFAGGMATGIATSILFAAILVNGSKTATSQFSERYTDLFRKVELSKKYFGQIANRESIGEARKIANHAINKLDGDAK